MVALAGFVILLKIVQDIAISFLEGIMLLVSFRG